MKVDAPPSLAFREEITPGGSIGFAPLEPMIYRPYAGSYPSRARSEAQVAQRASDSPGPRAQDSAAVAAATSPPTPSGIAAWQAMRTLEILAH